MENAPASDAHAQREPHICVHHHDGTDLVVVQEVGRLCVRINASWNGETRRLENRLKCLKYSSLLRGMEYISLDMMILVIPYCTGYGVVMDILVLSIQHDLSSTRVSRHMIIVIILIRPSARYFR